MVRNHRRFELLQVTLGGAPIGSATVDTWEDQDGESQWSARVLMKIGHGLSDGLLSGLTRDGRALSGQVRVGEDQQGPSGARSVLVELHGRGPLAERDASLPQDPPKPA